MSQNLTIPSGKQIETFKVWYTGKTINATAGSRTAIDADIKPGYVLCLDPYGHDNQYDANGDGTNDTSGLIDYTKPYTASLHLKKVVVVNVPAGSERGGWIDVTDKIDGLVYSHVNASVGDVLIVANDDFGLVAFATILTDGGNDIAAAQIKSLLGVCGVALEAADTSTTAANKLVSFRG